MTLHPKILELRNKISATPFKKGNPIIQPEEIRKANMVATGRTVKQYHARFYAIDDYGTIPMPGCFTKSINERGPESKAAYKITALYMHAQRDSVGLPSVLKEDEIGLYSEVDIIEGVQVAEETLIRHRRGILNNGSYGFNYVWDKMEYDEKVDAIRMYECELLEISYVLIGSDKDTWGVRNADGTYIDEFLIDETDEFIKKMPRKDQLELRTLIDRHIALAKNQPLEQRQKALEIDKPKQLGIDYKYLTEKFKT